MACARHCSRAELGGSDPLYDALHKVEEQRAEIKRLQKENEKLRNALGPFAYLGRQEFRPGDFNRARRALRLDEGHSR